jgi:type II secretion system protein N
MSPVTDPNPSSTQSGRATISPLIVIPLAVVLLSIFVALLFPWDSVARRIAHEIAAASGSQIEIGTLRPTLSARGPVLAAHDLTIQHPAVDRVRITTLEIAPRLSTSWFGAEPTLRFWADSELALIDGVLRLGESPTFVGEVSRVEIEKLPLRLDSSGFAVFGRVAAEADVALDPSGVLTGRVDFESPELLIQSDRLPLAIPFTRAAGVIEMLPNGATRIESIEFEGNVITGRISGEIAMAHRSQSPPIDLEAHLQIVAPDLRRLAPAAGIPISPDGKASLRLRGTLDTPEISPMPKPRGS